MPFQAALPALGLFGPLQLVLFLFVPAFVLLVRRRWRLAEVRREEIMRLVHLAAEESARAELETIAYSYSSYSPSLSLLPTSSSEAAASAEAAASPPVAGGVDRVCAVCYSPTTTRCSRCKAVKYCSGKCQIIHWRQGHKDECHPPKADVKVTAPGRASDPNVVEAGSTNLSDGSLEILTANSKPTYVGRPASLGSSCSSTNAKILLDTFGKESSSDSSTLSPTSSCSTFGVPTETSDDTSVRDIPMPVGPAECQEPSHIVDDSENNTVKVSQSELDNFRLAECMHPRSPVNVISSLNKLSQKPTGYSTERVGHESSGSVSSSFHGPEDCIMSKASADLPECRNASSDMTVAQRASCIDSIKPKVSENKDSAPTSFFSFNLPDQAISSSRSPQNEIPLHRDIPADAMGVSKPRDCPTSGFEVLVSERGRKNDGNRLLKYEGARSLSFDGSVDHKSSSSIGHSVSDVTSLNVGVASAVPRRLFGTTNSVSSGTYDLKTSVRRVVQQFNPIKLSKQSASGFGSEIAGKHSYKMLFPYDHFVKLYNEKLELRPCGLINCGNSCYANVVLQCLAFTRPLTAYLLQGLHSAKCPKKGWCFTCEFEGLVLKAKQGKSPLSPIGILSQIHNIGGHLGSGREEDAHEFLRYAIDAMQSACLKEAGENAVGRFAEETTLMQLIFGGYLRSKIKCMRCQGKSERHERMMDLTVEIDGDVSTLYDALKRFTTPEILDGDNKYRCNRCKSYEKATKMLQVLEAPNVLTIALKRFQSGKFGKLNKPVEYPEVLDLAKYVHTTSDKSPVYSLYAVVVHQDIMNATFSGHYVCYVKNHNKWYKTDDSMVKPVELDRVLSKTAYMLFYARCSPRAPRLVRSLMSGDYGKIKSSRWPDAVTSRHTEESAISKSRSNRVLNPNWTTNGPINNNMFDSSSDSSSLLSCSDEGSCSTESTRDSTSTSTEEVSEYIFGDSGHFSWNSPMRYSEDSDTSSVCSSSEFSPSWGNDHHKRSESYGGCPAGDPRARTSQTSDNGEAFWQGREGLSVLHSDTTKQCRELTQQYSSLRGTDAFNPNELKSRGTRDRATQTFY